MSDTIQSKFKESVYSAVCYGCSFGCGVYMRELEASNAEGVSCSAPILNIDYRKSSPVNQGKLCRFGVKLADTYSPAASSVKGETVSVDEAVSKAAEVLKNAKASDIAILSVGGTTNEEHLALIKIGEKLGVPVSTGMTGIFKDIGKLHAYLGRDTTYEDVEAAKKIYLLVDPYVSYPLLIRSLILAKEKGAEIVSFGLKTLPIAAKNVVVDPDASLYDVKEFAPDADTIIISDLTPYTYARRLAEVVEIAGGKSRFLFMRPFMNAAGAGYLSKHTKQASFDDIVSKMETGDLKVLVCLDSDLINICFNDGMRETFKNLENTIVITSRDTAVCSVADVVIATEPFYKKKGTVMNSEGRLIPITAAAGEMPLTGFNALSGILEALGGSALDYEAIYAEVVSTLGASVDEYQITMPEKKKKAPPETHKVSDKLPHLAAAFDCTSEPESFVSSASMEAGEVGACAAKHVYLTNPFLWNGVLDNDNYIEINRNQVRQSALLKGFTADVICACGEVRKTMRFKVCGVADGYVLSLRKQPFAKTPFTGVEVVCSSTKPKDFTAPKGC